MTENNEGIQDKITDELLKMANDGLIVIDGDEVVLTEKGRAYLETANDEST